jgi:hypothetical protein
MKNTPGSSNEIELPYGTTGYRSTSSLRRARHRDGVALSDAGHHSLYRLASTRPWKLRLPLGQAPHDP